MIKRKLEKKSKTEQKYKSTFLLKLDGANHSSIQKKERTIYLDVVLFYIAGFWKFIFFQKRPQNFDSYFS